MYNSTVGPPEDDAAAIAAVRTGDRDAFAVLVGRYQQAAFRAAYLVVRDTGAAEDVAQEAFVRAFSALATFRPGDPFRPWLLRIVTNLALNQVRSRGRRLGLLGRVAALREDQPSEPPDIAGTNEEQRAVWRAVNQLSLDDRLVLYHRYFLDLPEREIATALGIPPGTVKSRLHRAGTRLRAVIERDYPDLRPRAAEIGADHAGQ